MRGFAANKYGDQKEKGYKKIINKKKLDLHAQAITFGSFGSFGKEGHLERHQHRLQPGPAPPRDWRLRPVEPTRPQTRPKLCFHSAHVHRDYS